MEGLLRVARALGYFQVNCCCNLQSKVCVCGASGAGSLTLPSLALKVGIAEALEMAVWLQLKVVMQQFNLQRKLNDNVYQVLL